MFAVLSSFKLMIRCDSASERMISLCSIWPTAITTESCMDRQCARKKASLHGFREVYSEGMKQSPRVLVIDTAEGQKILTSIQKQFPPEANVKVLLATTHDALEELCWTTETKRDWGRFRPWRTKVIEKIDHFDCAVVNASIDLRDEVGQPASVLSYAYTLAENETPVLVHSPQYESLGRLQYLQE